MRALFIFVEGRHDEVFVRRSLGQGGFDSPLCGPLSEPPSPLGGKSPPGSDPVGFVARSLTARNLDQLNLKEAAHPPSPALEAVLPEAGGAGMALVLRAKGDRQGAACVKLLKDFKLVQGLTPGAQISSMAALFVFDADGALSERVQSFEREIGAPLQANGVAEPGVWRSSTVGPLGLFVLGVGPPGSALHGTLEDVLAPQVQERWPGPWQDANALLVAASKDQKADVASPSRRLKAQMTIAGQACFPGAPLTTVLDRDQERRGLHGAAFQGPVSQALIQMIRDAPLP